MELTIIQQLILGLIQGITEWLPISSSAFTILVMSNFYQITDTSFLLHAALLLHLGTFLAALIYFRNEVADLIISLFNYKKSNQETKNILKFLIFTTIISGIIGIFILKFISEINLELTGKSITFGIGFLLLITAGFQLSSKKKGLRKETQIKTSDSWIAGIAQGFASLPGISRSGITISTLLLKKFDDTTALRLSFLMSMPIVLLGNIFLNFGDFTFTSTTIYGLLASFIFGLLTIHGLMRLSKRINFGWFVLGFAVLMMLSVII